MARTLVIAPKTARRGEVVTIRATIQHAMESGQRVDADGRRVPANLVRRFECRVDGEPVFAADFASAIAANPMVAFDMLATGSGTLTLDWRGDNGFSHSESLTLTVT